MADDTSIKIGLSPEEVIAALKQMGDQVGKLAAQMDDALGKKSSQSINDLKDNAEKGTNQISKFFSNMGTRIREDLKTAFDVSAIMAGANFAKQIQEGVRGVFDMERAFDRLGVRLNLTTRQMEDFKRQVGRVTAANGVNVTDIQGGLMAAASAGVKDPKQLTMVAESLSRARQIDPGVGSGEAITDNIAEILRRQHLEINGANFQKTMDALNGATATGNFRDTNDAGSHVAALSAYSSTNGMDTRQLAGIATMASKGGPAVQALLNQILEGGGGPDQGARLNATLGREVFKNGKLDANELGKVNPNQFGATSILGEASGLSGANGGDLKVLIETFRDNMDSFKQVVDGTNETAKQYDAVSQSWAAKTEAFKARLQNAGREFGDGLAQYVDGLTSGDSEKKAGGIGNMAGTLWDNKGDLAAGGALTLGAGMLMGGGIRGLMGRATASATGVQQVYVTNAAEIKGDGVGDKLGIMDKVMGSSVGKKVGSIVGGMVANAMILGPASLSTIGGMGAGAIGMAGAGVAAAGAVGYGVGKGVNYLTGNEGQMGEKLYDYLNPDTSAPSNLSPQQVSDLMAAGMLKALREHDNKPSLFTNPSSVRGQGPKVGQ